MVEWGKSVLFCGELLWITSVTEIKCLIDGFSFGWFLIVYSSTLVSVINERKYLKLQSIL